MELAEVEAVLGRTPDVVRSLLMELPTEWVRRNDGPGTWSAHDIVGHLILADTTNWLPRIRMILEHGPDRAFEPFDREAMLTWQQEDPSALTARFHATRDASLRELGAMNLTSGDLGRRGLHAQVGELTMAQLLATWVSHDLTHVGQISDVLARRYRDDVGPMRVFMPRLDEIAAAE